MTNVKVRYVILDLSPNGNIDTTALSSLQELLNDYKARGVTLCLCNPAKDVMERFVTSCFVEKIGYENIFVSEHQAVSACLTKLAGADEVLATNVPFNCDDQQSILPTGTFSDSSGDGNCDV